MKHQFAIYVDALSQEPGLLQPGSLYVIHDKELTHRIIHVLRLKQSEEVVFFDRRGHAVGIIQEIDKKKIICSIQSYLFNKQLEPAITILLPLLKREAFEEAIYSAVELGASVVQPVVTDKTQRGWSGAKEKERVQRIMVAAAEQSKNFSLPVLHDPIELAQAVNDRGDSRTKIFFDPSGKPLLELLNNLGRTKPNSLVCMVGPEGDLSAEEKEFLKSNGFQFYALTPTVLRASQALVVGLGALRSI